MKKALLILFGALGLLFFIYMKNLDMKLMRSVILPFLNRHYDRQKPEHVI